MSLRAPKYSIILAAGKGTRMRSESLHKVCFTVDGEPVINRNIKTYKESGIKNHIVVVGTMAGQVIETIGKKHDGIIFAYQPEQTGTANATRQGIKVLESFGENEDVLIVAGDRIIEPIVLDELYNLFYTHNCDMAFLVGPKKPNTSSSSVLFYPDGSVLGNVEVIDMKQKQIYGKIRQTFLEGKTLSAMEIVQLISEYFTEKKAAVAFGELWKSVAVDKQNPSTDDINKWITPQMTYFEFANQSVAPVIITPEQVNEATVINCSVYLIKTKVLRYAFSLLNRNNAQKEEYLSDIITILAQARKGNQPEFNVKTLYVDNPQYLMAFNDPSELLEIEEYVQSKKQKRMAELPASNSFKTIGDWKKSFNNVINNKHKEEKALCKELVSLYSDNTNLISERAKTFLETLEHASGILGENERVMLIRSPGRVNLMGRHVDHQGGNCNLMTIGYETLMIIRPRKDHKIQLYNVNEEQFPYREFSISELLVDLPWDNWWSLVNSKKVSELIISYGSDWSQYVKASVLRLQKRFADQKLRGADIIVNGNIPTASGLSSSSALVVGTAEAMIAVNRLEIFPSQFVDLCGEGEWFVGTRGGSGDHAAIKFGQKDKVVKVTFFDFAVEEIVPFPDDCILAVCNSGIKAKKTTNAKDQFNHRVACYNIGLRLIKKYYPQYSPLINHLRDLNTRNLNVPLSWIYKIMLRLPEQATQDELKKLLPNEDIEPFFKTHISPDNGLYPIRGVVLFGIAECERSRIFADALQINNIAEIGRLMNVSHDGDRVSCFTSNDIKKNYHSPISNDYLLDLIDDLESGDPERVNRSQLQWQPGSYRCSLPEIDYMVDISKRTEGVLGAQLAGAGLGGCMMVLARKDAINRLIDTLTEKYYKKYGKETSIMICKPVAGSSVLLKK